MGRIVNFRLVSLIVSRVVLLIAVSMVICAAIALAFSEPVTPFLITSFIALTIGGMLHVLAKGEGRELIIQRKEAVLAVALSWVLTTLIGSFPYLISRSIPSFVDAFFESVSGFTTTGSSILTDIESLPGSILFWRSLTHWIGGLGIIVLFIIIMPQLKVGGYHLFTLESSLQEKIHPRIRSVGLRLLFIYLGLTLLEMIFLLAGGMSLFESVCHSFGTIATGGFSPKNTSIAGYSGYIQYVIMGFMLLAGTNFIVHYYLITKNFRKIKENEEWKFFLFVILFLGIVVSTIVFKGMDKSLEESIREGFFQVISIVTCTGYATADYLLWPQSAWVIIFMAMFLGGSTGSTAGGIKMARHLVLYKNLRIIIRRLASPNAVITLRFNNSLLDEDTNRSILTFMFIYLVIFLVGTWLLVILGIEAKTASGSVATCMAGIGPGIGEVGPASNFAFLPGPAKIILAILMLVGRLEIYAIILLFTGTFWKK